MQQRGTRTGSPRVAPAPIPGAPTAPASPTGRAPGGSRPAYAVLLPAATQVPAIVATVARDVAGPDESPADVESDVRPAVERLLAMLSEGPEPSRSMVAALRAEGGDAARAGETVERVIDRYLSAGWAVWAVACEQLARKGRRTGSAPLAALGAALLRTGDVAAAAVAEGHGATSRQVVGRAATARAELLEELLEGLSGPDAGPRVARHAAAVGLDLAGRFEVVVAAAGSRDVEPDVEAASAVLERSARPTRRSARRSPGLVGARGDRLVAVVTDGLSDAVLAEAMTVALGAGWFATRSTASTGLSSVRSAYLEASAALVAALRSGSAGHIAPSDSLLVERTLLADEALLRAMVDGVLGPLARAPRGGPDLVITLEAWLDAGLNGQETARRLGVSPRTIAYRLARVERLTRRPLEGREITRLSVALLGRRLLAG